MTDNLELTNLINLTANMLDAHTVAVFRTNEQKTNLQLSRFFSLSKKIRKQTVIPFGEGHIGWAAQNKKALFTAQRQYKGKELPYYKGSVTVRTLAAVPLCSGTELWGVLCVDQKDHYQLSSKEQKLLTSLADQYALSLHREKQLEAERQEITTSKALLTICEQMSGKDEQELLNCWLQLSHTAFAADGWLIATVPEQKNSLYMKADGGFLAGKLQGKVLSAQEGLAGLVIRENQPLMLTDNRRTDSALSLLGKQISLPNAGSFIGIPFSDDRTAVGALFYIRKQGKPSFSETDYRIAKMLGKQFANHWRSMLWRERFQSCLEFDLISGLPNHSAFQQTLTKISKTYTGKPFSLFCFQLTDLDLINQRYGYQVGDRLLYQVGQLIKEYQEEKGVAGRISGAKMALLFPDISQEKTDALAASLQKIFAQKLFFVAGKEFTTTIQLAVGRFFDYNCSQHKLFSQLQPVSN